MVESSVLDRGIGGVARGVEEWRSGRRTSMLAIQAAGFGGPDVLVPVQRAAPRPGPGEALVEVEFSDVLVADTWMRRGERGVRLVLEPPYVPGCGIAGRVASVGDGVEASLVGRRVVAHAVGGGYVDLAAIPAGQLVPVPDALDLAQAAALLHAGPAALAIFEQARIPRAAHVLVTAGAGATGSLLVQLAHAAGAHVIALVRGGAKADLARACGADVVVDAAASSGWAASVLRATQGRGADIVLDGVGGRAGRAALEVTARGGSFLSYGTASGEVPDLDPGAGVRRGVRVADAGCRHPGPGDVARVTARTLRNAATGRLRAFIGQVFPLHLAAEAHAAMEARRTVGKTLLRPG